MIQPSQPELFPFGDTWRAERNVLVQGNDLMLGVQDPIDFDAWPAQFYVTEINQKIRALGFTILNDRVLSGIIVGNTRFDFKGFDQLRVESGDPPHVRAQLQGLDPIDLAQEVSQGWFAYNVANLLFDKVEGLRSFPPITNLI